MKWLSFALLLVAAPAWGQATGGTAAHYDKGNLTYTDDKLTPDGTIWANCPLLAQMGDPAVATVLLDDFFGYTDADKFTATLTDTGVAACVTAGLMEIQTSAAVAADNNEAYLGGTDTWYTLAAGKDLWFEARVKLTEANTDDANIIVGLASTSAANTLQDNGAGPPANYDGLVFFKVDGGTVWQAEASSGSGTQTTNSSISAFTSGAFVRLGIYVQGTSSATFYINGEAVAEISTYLPDNAIAPVFGVKNGGANEEKLYVDYIRVVQLR